MRAVEINAMCRNPHSRIISWRRLPQIFGCLLGSLVLGQMSIPALHARDYFVSANGDDSSAATKADPWKTIDRVNRQTLQQGDRVLFHGGDTLQGNLVLDKSDSGVEGRRIVISSYGKGRAIIDAGDGHGIVADACDHLSIAELVLRGSGRKNGNDGSGIWLTNSSDLEVDQVEVTGFRLSGVSVDGVSEVRITHVHAHENGFAGISSGKSTLSSNLYVAHCLAENNPGDPKNKSNHSGNGIVIGVAKDVLVEYCIARNNGWDMPWDGNGPVGIWCWNTDHITIQHCISHDNRSPAWDGGGFDLDGGTRNGILQYNLSYNNDGPGYFVCQYYAAPPMKDNIIRYNISQNDARKNNHKTALRISSLGSNASDCQIYNNTIYTEVGAAVGFGGSPIPDVVFRNNVFVSANDLVSGDFSAARFEGNVWWCIGESGFRAGEFLGFEQWVASTGQEKLGDKVVGRYANPLLLHAGLVKCQDPSQLTRLTAYRLHPDSPCLNAGMSIQDNGGRDFWGTRLPLQRPPSIGACQQADDRFDGVQNVSKRPTNKSNSAEQ